MEEICKGGNCMIPLAEITEMISKSDIGNVIKAFENVKECKLNDLTDFRPLTDDEKVTIKEKTGWSDKILDDCLINNDGVVKFPCKNEKLAEQKHPETGVEYVTKIVDVNGVKVEVVSPKFESKFDAQLPDDLLKEKDKDQFKECNKQLYEKIQSDPEFAKQFSEEQIEQIKDGITKGGAPDGYVWHHNEESGKMQLVESDVHAKSGHTGGRVIWGPGND